MYNRALRELLRKVGRIQTHGIHSKPSIYVATPIFYVNANPHLGHLYNMILSDTRIRWEQLKSGSSTFFTTGTDEHGLKIQTVAEAKGVSPKELCDSVSQNFRKLAQDLDIHYDRFIRTTDEDHIEAAQYFWTLLREKGLIQEGLHKGWYSVSDETFYPETQIEEFTDPVLNTQNYRSKETKSIVAYQEETNYFFRLSDFQDRLIDHLEMNPSFVIPTSKYQQLLAELKANKLPDLSISRPSSRVSWAIDIPNDSLQKMYVWFEALVNYLTSAGFPKSFERHVDLNGEISHSKNGDFQQNPWPATHVVGKDIIRFHAIYWPILLMAAGIELPHQVVVHSHWLSDGFKMSKSLGNVVDPQKVASYYGTDLFRFFVMEYSTLETDCNYQEDAFYFTRENIVSKYANLVTRCGGGNFNIARAVSAFREGKFDRIGEVIIKSSVKSDIESIEKSRMQLIERANKISQVMDDRFKLFDQLKAINEWWQLCESGNEIFQLGQPWVYTKTFKELPEHELLMDYYTFLALEVSRISSILIQPIMPELSLKILDRLGVDSANRTLERAIFGGDLSYGRDANKKGHSLPIVRIPQMGKEEEVKKVEKTKKRN